MNDKKFLVDMDAEQPEGERAAHRKVYSAILAAILCIALALAVWVGVMNTQDTDFIPVRVVAPMGYECTLSVDGVEVEGRVCDLRYLDELVINLSQEDVLEVLARFGGEASVSGAFLRLPEGVYLTRAFSAILTVKAK